VCNSVISNPECLSNSDCDQNEYCSNFSCIIKHGKSCILNSDCAEDESCSQEVCSRLDCENNFSVKEHSCYCSGTVCNKTCYSTEGVCCKNNWNELVASCQLDSSLVIDLIEKSGDTEAIELLNSANKSALNGELVKANAQLLLAELKAKLSLLSNHTEETIVFEQAKLALEKEEYASASLLAKSTIESIGEVNVKEEGFDYVFVIIAVLLIISGFLVYKKYIVKNTEIDN
jgi:hypothetical protein